MFDSNYNQQASVRPRHGIGVCESNGNREHWNVEQRAAALPKPSIVAAKFFNGELRCFNVPDPTQRYD